MGARRFCVAFGVIAVVAFGCTGINDERKVQPPGPATIAEPSSAIVAGTCMEDNWHQAGNKQGLQCTANDVSIAKASNIRDPITKQPITVCNAGQPLSFLADFTVQLTSQTRFDIGLYFAIDGDPNGDGALTGTCSENVITPLVNGLGSHDFINLDPSATDTCGDIDSADNPQIVTVLVSNVLCQAGANGMLSLPNCTSWREPGSIIACTGPADAYPGSPSKCNCDQGFTVPVFVETGSIAVTKAASPASLPEPGGAFTYTVGIQNTAQFTTVTINSICDDKYGTIAGSGCPAGTVGSISSTTCTVPIVLAPQQVATPCTFTANFTSNDPASLTDTVTASGVDQNGKPVSNHASAQVAVTDVPPTAMIVKSLNSLLCSTVRYNVSVQNTSKFDALNLTALSDSAFGDITMVQGSVVATTCSVTNVSIPVGGPPYTCTFDANFCGNTHTDTITGTINDGEGHTITPVSNTLTVTTSATQ
jgi:hypothetical protein